MFWENLSTVDSTAATGLKDSVDIGEGVIEEEDGVNGGTSRTLS